MGIDEQWRDKSIIEYKLFSTKVKYEHMCEGLLCDVILVAMETAAGNVLQIKPT